MKKLLVAAALAGVTVFTGAASAAPAVAPVNATQAGHTLKWKLNETASHNVGKHGFVGTDTIRSVRTGEIVGYDSTSGAFFPATSRVQLDVAASLRGGILIGRVRANFATENPVFRGPVIGGSGRFHGAEGTIVAKPVGEGTRTLVTVHYHF